MPRTSAPTAILPVYARTIVRERARGRRPQTRNERWGKPAAGGLDDLPIIYATDRWRLAKMLRELGLAAVVIEPGLRYNWTFAREWAVFAKTAGPFPGLRDEIRAGGALIVTHTIDALDAEHEAAALLKARELQAAQ